MSMIARDQLAVAHTVVWAPALGAVPDADGVCFRVWAPDAASVDVVYDQNGATAVAPLEREADGYFAARVAGIEPGARYRFRLDGERLLPDPASRFQPDGPFGPSEVVDAGAFTWTDAGWPGVSRDNLVIYELHVGTFTHAGTFAGVEARLDYLRLLGVTAIELMPVADFAGSRNWGYDGVALFAPSHTYGRPDDLRRLVDAAHRRGLGVILDVVYNHLGPDGATWAAYTPKYFNDRHKTPWGAAVNLDGADSEHVRGFLTENALHWIHEYHLDGLRLDATHALRDDRERPFLAEVADAVHTARPHRPAILIAEDDRHTLRIVDSPSDGGFGLDGLWADDFHHEVRRLVAGDSEGYFARYRGTASGVAHTLANGGYLDGEPRDLNAFVFCLQNHDQVGNRARGDRLHHTIGEAEYRAASALLLCAPETPLLFMGQEWATSSPFCYFTDHRASLGIAITEGRRNEFAAFSAFQDPDIRNTIPDPQDVRTFESSRLDWAEIDTNHHARTFRLYQALLAQRRTNPALRDSSRAHVSAEALDDATVALWRRHDDTDVMLVVARLIGRGTVEIPIDDNARRWTVILTTEDAAFSAAPHPPRIALRGSTLSVTFACPAAIVLRGRR